MDANRDSVKFANMDRNGKTHYLQSAEWVQWRESCQRFLFRVRELASIKPIELEFEPESPVS